MYFFAPRHISGSPLRYFSTMPSKSKAKLLAPESSLILPRHPALSTASSPDIVDTHTHILSTYQAYGSKYNTAAENHNIKSFIKAFLLPPLNEEAEEGKKAPHHRVKACVDVWCEAPTPEEFHHVLESLSTLKVEDDFDYHYVIGAHPNEAQSYNDDVEQTYIKAYQHPRCVGWGEIGLDYHFPDPSRETQKTVLKRQLKVAQETDPDKAFTIHTREADEDIVDILTTSLPRAQKLHIHCFTDAPETAQALLDHFPNCFIGITGVITYASNLNTAQIVRNMSRNCSPSSPANLRILLETDAPYMVPSNLGPPSSLGMKSGQKLPFSHSGMIPWVAEFVAKILNEGNLEGDQDRWTTEDVLKVARENARSVYGI